MKILSRKFLLLISVFSLLVLRFIPPINFKINETEFVVCQATGASGPGIFHAISCDFWSPIALGVFISLVLGFCRSKSNYIEGSLVICLAYLSTSTFLYHSQGYDYCPCRWHGGWQILFFESSSFLAFFVIPVWIGTLVIQKINQRFIFPFFETKAKLKK